jgi:hypothetical protein
LLYHVYQVRGTIQKQENTDQVRYKTGEKKDQRCHHQSYRTDDDETTAEQRNKSKHNQKQGKCDGYGLGKNPDKNAGQER